MTETFVDAAEAFCRWAEGPGGPPDAEAAVARRLLPELYRLALDLPPAMDYDTDAPVPGEAQRRGVFERFGALPFNYYAIVDPLVLLVGDSMTGDLADDLADIWHDLKIGLTLHRAGRVEQALHEWRWRFDTHWAQHAADALYALQAWVTKRAGEQAVGPDGRAQG